MMATFCSIRILYNPLLRTELYDGMQFFTVSFIGASLFSKKLSRPESLFII
jgi:hypothetical protein